MKTKFINRYRVEVYYGGEQIDVTVETNDLEQAKQIASLGEFALIFDNKTNKIFEPAEL